MAKLFISPEAQKDLLSIKQYIVEELNNPQAADNTVKNILLRMRLLIEQPMMGATLTTIGSHNTGYRFVSSGNYLIFYRTDSKSVHVVRVLYKRRDFMQILFKDVEDETE